MENCFCLVISGESGTLIGQRVFGMRKVSGATPVSHPTQLHNKTGFSVNLRQTRPLAPESLPPLLATATTVLLFSLGCKFIQSRKFSQTSLLIRGWEHPKFLIALLYSPSEEGSDVYCACFAHLALETGITEQHQDLWCFQRKEELIMSEAEEYEVETIVSKRLRKGKLIILSVST